MIYYCLQLLCPERHCLHACTYDERSSFDTAVVGMEIAMPPHRGPHCMICGSHDVHYEARPYRLQGTQYEIAAEMMAEQQMQTANREMLRRLRIPVRHWPSDMRWNYDHLLDLDQPAIFRHLHPRDAKDET